jgi:hypothetical protein
MECYIVRWEKMSKKAKFTISEIYKCRHCGEIIQLEPHPVTIDLIEYLRRDNVDEHIRLQENRARLSRIAYQSVFYYNNYTEIAQITIGEDVPLFPHKCPDGDYGMCEFESFKILSGEEQLQA